VVIELSVQIEGIMKVVQDLLSLFLFTAFIENDGATFFQFHGLFLIGKPMRES
jgi:hypothetical protein